MWSYLKSISTQIPKLVIGSTAALYTIGLLISNIYLGNFGILDFSLTRPVYLLIGVASAIFLLSPAILLTSLIVSLTFLLRFFCKLIRRDWKGSGAACLYSVLYALVFLSWIVLWIPTSFIFKPTNSSVERLSSLFTYWAIYVDGYLASFLSFFLALVAAITIISFLWRNDHTESTSKNTEDTHFIVLIQLSGSLLFFGLLVLFLMSYSVYVHPRAQFEFGGGLPRIVDIYLSREDVSATKHLGLLADSDGLLRNVKLVHETSRSLYLLLPESQWREGQNIAIEVPQTKIVAVGHQFTKK